MLKILCIGPQFRGSNAGALFRALSRTGHLISIIDEFYYIPFLQEIKLLKVFNKALRRIYIVEYNKAIRAEYDKLQPDIVLVYKGAFVLPSTVSKLSKNSLIVNFYPDVSFHTHGPYLRRSLGKYHHIFTTKTFGIVDLEQQLGAKDVTFIPHGFDPEIHRKLPQTLVDSSPYQCDVSFIGTWSHKKEKILSFLVKSTPGINLKVWGNQWNHNQSINLKSHIQGHALDGDLYALAIQSSKINLGILSEKVWGASSGDKITSRTFHIPATSGFMLHEKNEESVLYFKEDIEVGFFEHEKELISKIDYYLNNEDHRKEIALSGYNRAQREHALDHRAKELINVLVQRFNL